MILVWREGGGCPGPNTVYAPAYREGDLQIRICPPSRHVSLVEDPEGQEAGEGEFDTKDDIPSISL